jgi:hypothetical protein
MNEPVAWRIIVEGKTYVTDDNEFVVKMWQHNGWKEEPLYTHPAKTLTDEEIDEVAQALIDDCCYCSLHFARAILRKAQEK